MPRQLQATSAAARRTARVLALAGATLAGVLAAGALASVVPSATSASASASPWSAAYALGSGDVQVSCAGSSLCMAVDASGHARTWNGTTWSDSSAVSALALRAVSCTDATSEQCVAVDAGGTAWTWNGSAWSSLPTGDSAGTLDALSCVGTSFCMAGDTGGATYVYRGSSWASAGTLLGPIDTVDCVSATACWAADADGNVYTWAGTSWSAAVAVSSATASLSCPDASDCFVADGAGNLYAWTSTGGTWSEEASHLPAAASTLSCPTDSSCVAGLSGGEAYDWTPTGGWVESQALGSDGVDSLSCPSAGFCVAGDTGGDLFMSPSQAPVITTVSLPAGSVGAAYDATLSATGGSGSYTWSLSGSSLPLPTGLTLSSAGAITGSDTAAPSTYDVTVVATDADAASADAALSITVARGTQTVQFANSAPTGSIYGGGFTPIVTATSGLAPVITVDPTATSVCALSGAIVEFIGVGTCTLDANQPGNADYAPAPQLQLSFVIDPAPQTLAFTTLPPSNAVVGDTYEPVVSSTSGLTPVISVAPASSNVCSFSGSTLDLVATGTCTLLADQPGDTDYAAANEVTQTFVVADGTPAKGGSPVTPVATAPAPKARPVLDPLQTELVVSGAHQSKLAVHVTCLDGPCTGSLELTVAPARGHGKKAIVLARGSFHLRSPKAAVVELKTKRPALRQVRKRLATASRLSATLRITLTGQHPIDQQVYLVG